MRICTKCNTPKDDYCFPINKQSPDGLKSWCIQCSKLHDKSRDWGMRMYGLSKREIQLKLKQQEGKCSVCRNQFIDTKDINVDHNHKTGLIRDLLCSKCNFALGLLNEDSVIITRLLTYILKWKDQKPELRHLFKV